MDVRFIADGRIEEHPAEDLKGLLQRSDGFVWVDMPVPDRECAEVLTELFGAHPLAVRDSLERSHVAKVRAYPSHLFVVVHAPEAGDAGQVHLLELDQFIGPNYLVTIHGPLGEGVALEAALREAKAIVGKIDGGRLRPNSSAELAHAIVGSMANRMETYVSGLATKIAELERRVMKGEAKDPEKELEELFKVRHELLTIRTMAAGGREVYRRMASLTRFLPEHAHPFIEDIIDRYDRVTALCDSEKEFLQGVVDFYQSRTSTKMNVAMERLALISALVLPVTAVASIYGMNIIVNQRTDMTHILGVVGVMGLVAFLMLRWARRHGWW